MPLGVDLRVADNLHDHLVVTLPGQGRQGARFDALRRHRFPTRGSGRSVEVTRDYLVCNSAVKSTEGLQWLLRAML